MAFTDSDREKLVETHTLVKRSVEDIQENKDEIKVLHHRVNVVRNLYGGVTAAFGGLLAYLKIGAE